MLVFLLVCLLGSCIARLSPRVMVASPAALFASRPSDRPSLLCLFVRRLSGTSPSLVRVVDPSLVFLLESSLSYRCLVASPLGSTGHCVRFGSAVRFYTPRGTAVRFYTPRGTVPFDSPCVHSYSICWLSLAATLFTHTLSHAWCPVTLLSLTCCSRVVVLLESFWSPSRVVVRSVVIAVSRVFRHEGCLYVVREWMLRLHRQFPWLL